MGVGTFGRVIECYDKKMKQNVALKVVRKVPKYTDGAKIEADILNRIQKRSKSATAGKSLVSVSVFVTFL